MAGKAKVFLDTDVVLDHLANREPFAEYANRLFALAEQGRISVSVSSLSFSNLHFLLRKLTGHSTAISLLVTLKRITQVAAVTEAEIEAALVSDFPDFEDAIQYFTAKAEGGITAIVTRNKNDYGQSEIPVFTADEFLNQVFE